MTGRVLIIDDDRKFCRLLAAFAEEDGHQVVEAYTLEEGLAITREQAFDLVFLDVRLPDGNGLAALPSLRGNHTAEIVIITSAGDPDGAEMAVQSGAWDYLQKPFTCEQVKRQIARAITYRRQKAAALPPSTVERDEIVGQSHALHGALFMASRAAETDATVLITGETGTGKELFARVIHRNSLRANGPFVTVDCAALPASLAEALLFGHTRGAFTGVEHSREGLLASAHGGTLFLDEVGELPYAVQKAFLRVLQERRFRAIGSEHERESDFRVLASTHRDLDAMVSAGQFRDDLLHRLRPMTLEVPPLRKRMEDVENIVLWHVERRCKAVRAEVKELTPELMEALVRYPWPGNVRELLGSLDAALASAGSAPTLFSVHLPTAIRAHLARTAIAPDDVSSKRARQGNLGSLRDHRDRRVSELEREYLARLMERTGGNIQEACRVSELSRSRLYALLKKHGLLEPDRH